MQGLLKMGIRGVTVSDVRGFGAQGGSTERQAGKLSLYRIVGILLFSVFLWTPNHGLSQYFVGAHVLPMCLGCGGKWKL